jgi:hypothetical protein
MSRGRHRPLDFLGSRSPQITSVFISLQLDSQPNTIKKYGRLIPSLSVHSIKLPLNVLDDRRADTA